MRIHGQSVSVFTALFLSLQTVVFAAALTANAAPPAPAPKFYRIIQGNRPDAAQAAIDRYTYGTDVLYTGDAVARPTRVEGIVWHSNLEEAKYFLGTRNPVIGQRAIMESIESDKWAEAKILMKYVPDSFPRTENMAELLQSLRAELGRNPDPATRAAALRELGAELKRRYPDGYFMKPIAGFNSDGTFPTEKTSFDQVYESWIRDVKPRYEATLQRTGDATETHLEFKDEKFYEGRVLEALFDHPETVIIQEKIRAATGNAIPIEGGGFKTLIEEYRVHVVEGKVLAGATQNRWDDIRAASPERIAAADVAAQAIVNSLPPEMRKMCFGMDLMRTDSGQFKVIELNAGGESGYLYPEVDLWTTQLLAEHYLGRPTALQRQLKRFRDAPTFAAKETALDELLSRKELRALMTETDPLWGLLVQAKDDFLNLLRQSPTRDAAFQTLSVVQKFKLGPTLSKTDVEFFGGVLGDAGLHPAEIATSLALDSRELLFYTPARTLSLLTGMNYDDAFVEGQVARLVRERMRSGGEGVADESLARRIALETLNERVLTRAQLRATPSTLELVAHNSRDALSDGARLLYTGTREALLTTVLESLLRP